MKIREKTNLEICDENQLKVSILSNVAEEKTTKNQIRATLQIISKILCSTLGPYGQTTILQDTQFKHHLVTKDGYDLLNKMSFDNEISRTVLDIVRNISSNQVASVGDGSTSAIVVANALYNAITDSANQSIFERVAAKDIVDMLNYLAEYLTEEILKIANPISEDMHELDTVASVSLNNDRDCGKMVADIYRKIGKYGFVTTDAIENHKKDVVEFREGIHWSRTYIDEFFAMKNPNKKIIHEEPLLFITTESFTQDHLPLLTDVIGHAVKQGRSIVIVCQGADQDARTFFKKNRLKHLTSKTPELEFSVVDIDNITETSRATLRNLALLSGCEIYSPLENMQHTHPYFLANENKFYGKVAKVILSPAETQVICDEALIPESFIEQKKEKEVELLERINTAKLKEDRSIADEQEIFFLQSEYNGLLGNSAVLHVGGQTLTERMSRERLFEDAILACRSAMNYGVIYGGNLVIPRILTLQRSDIVTKLADKFTYLPYTTREYLEDFCGIFVDVVKTAFAESYMHVLENAYFTDKEVADTIDRCITEGKFYNLKTHKFENMSETSVINSVDTDIQILKACVSIIGLLATSNQMVISSFCTLDALRPDK